MPKKLCAKKLQRLQGWLRQRKTARPSVRKMADTLEISERQVRYAVSLIAKRRLGSRTKREVELHAASSQARAVLEQFAAKKISSAEAKRKLRSKSLTAVASAKKKSTRTIDRIARPQRDKLRDARQHRIERNRQISCTPPSRFLYSARNIY